MLVPSIYSLGHRLIPPHIKQQSDRPHKDNRSTATVSQFEKGCSTLSFEQVHYSTGVVICQVVFLKSFVLTSLHISYGLNIGLWLSYIGLGAILRA